MSLDNGIGAEKPMSETEIKGILGNKLGMTQVFDEQNRVVPVTVVKAGPCVVTQVRTEETDGYNAVQIAFGAIDPRKVTKPVAGHFAKAGVTPRRHIAEIRLADADAAANYEVGQELTADIFEAGAFVDVTGTSKGKGYAGTMKRHGFAGQGAAHGTQAVHRRPGSIGACATPGPRLQGHAHVWSYGRRACHHPEPESPEGRCRAGLILIKGASPVLRDAS
ncbi:MAG: 50S ribosomal protein L3 [Lawsonella clevelandensis]